MKPSFVNSERPLITVMIKQTQNPENCIAEIGRARKSGAEAFGIQMESLPREYHTPETVCKIFDLMKDRPLYVTNYKLSRNADMSYEEVTDELVNFAGYGATLCDITGDTFCKHPEELTDDKAAVKKQMEVIERLHKQGAEVVMSSHVNKFISAERVFEIAAEHQRRGADISKIVTAGNSMEEQVENLRITEELKRQIKIPYLYLSGGTHCRIHRRIGILLGCCMSLCVCDDAPLNPQPFMSDQLNIRDNMKFEVTDNEGNISK